MRIGVSSLPFAYLRVGTLAVLCFSIACNDAEISNADSANASLKANPALPLVNPGLPVNTFVDQMSL